VRGSRSFHTTAIELLGAPADDGGVGVFKAPAGHAPSFLKYIIPFALMQTFEKFEPKNVNGVGNPMDWLYVQSLYVVLGGSSWSSWQGAVTPQIGDKPAHIPDPVLTFPTNVSSNGSSRFAPTSIAPMILQE
jgi:hypothetical protein